MNAKMTVEEAKRVIEALDFLDNLNKKLGYPHGYNPTGVVFEAVKILKEEEKNNNVDNIQ